MICYATKERVKNLFESENWKKFVQDTRLVGNISGILEDCYPFFHKSATNKEDFKAKIGMVGSEEWRVFVIKVIELLKERGSFSSGDDPDVFDESFGDTAGGCDEITESAGYRVLELMGVAFNFDEDSDDD
jgi:hypothetical protein